MCVCVCVRQTGFHATKIATIFLDYSFKLDVNLACLLLGSLLLITITIIIIIMIIVLIKIMIYLISVNL